MDLSVVVPVYNNASTLRELAARLQSAVSQKVASFELIFVDDGSRDQSWSVIQELARVHPFVSGLRLSRNFGQHPAIAAGFTAARGEVIVLMDADLEDRPESVPPLLDAFRAKPVDIVYTVTAHTGASRGRWTSALFHKAFSLAVRADVPENIGTLRAFTRKVREAILSYREYNALYGPLMFFLGFDCAFLEVQRDVRAERRSSYSLFSRLRLAQTTLMSYTNLPSTFLLGSGVVIFTATVGYIAVILIQHFLGADTPPGLALLALLVLAGLAINLIAFGVLGAYIYRVYQEVLQRPRFHVRENTVAFVRGSAVERTPVKGVN